MNQTDVNNPLPTAADCLVKSLYHTNSKPCHVFDAIKYAIVGYDDDTMGLCLTTPSINVKFPLLASILF
jgi:hypothetical protein